MALSIKCADLVYQNISFKPPIENVKLQTEFLNHDIFILPSVSEPWGLVVEETLYFGLPVMVSKIVVLLSWYKTE